MGMNFVYTQNDLYVNAILEMFTTEDLGTKLIENKEGMIGWTCRKQWRYEKQKCIGKREGEDHLGDPGVDVRKIVTWILKKQGANCIHLSSEQEPLAGLCEHDNEP
jgi:hypothetical protein